MGDAGAAPYQPSCTVVICTRDRPECLDRCLEALSRVTYPNFEVLVVDNAPSDDRARQVAERWSARHVVEPDLGLDRARNTGARLAAGKIIAYTDDDAVPQPDWLTHLVAGFRDPKVMVVTGRNVPPDGLAQTHPHLVTDLGPEARRLDLTHPLWFEMANFGGIGTGSNMAFRRSAFDVGPGFDVRLDRGAPLHGGGEHHAFFSVIESGYAILYTPAAEVIHPRRDHWEDPATSISKDLRAAVAYMTLLLFESRHKRRVIRYLLGAACGAHRPWRWVSVTKKSYPLPFHNRLVLLLEGFLLYVRNRSRVCGVSP
jgi:glycosyltransferase involved in cell wall biosynthesis